MAGRAALGSRRRPTEFGFARAAPLTFALQAAERPYHLAPLACPNVLPDLSLP